MCVFFSIHELIYLWEYPLAIESTKKEKKCSLNIRCVVPRSEKNVSKANETYLFSRPLYWLN